MTASNWTYLSIRRGSARSGLYDVLHACDLSRTVSLVRIMRHARLCTCNCCNKDWKAHTIVYIVQILFVLVWDNCASLFPPKRAIRSRRCPTPPRRAPCNSCPREQGGIAHGSVHLTWAASTAAHFLILCRCCESLGTDKAGLPRTPTANNS